MQSVCKQKVCDNRCKIRQNMRMSERIISYDVLTQRTVLQDADSRTVAGKISGSCGFLCPQQCSVPSSVWCITQSIHDVLETVTATNLPKFVPGISECH